MNLKTKIVGIFIFTEILYSVSLYPQKKVEIFPSNNTDTTEMLIGKNITYFLLEPHNEIVLNLSEKTERLTIFSRTILAETNEITSYSFSYRIDAGKSKTVKIKNTKISKLAKTSDLSQSSIISTVRKTVIDIPKDTKHIIFGSKDNPVLIHFKQEITDEKKWEDLKNIQFDNPELNVVHIIVGKPFKYFRLSEKKPTILNVKGSGKFFIYARFRLPVEGNKTLSKGLVIKMDDEKIQFKKMKDTQPANNAVYLNSDNLPSKVNKFLISIPPEKHQIKIYSKNINSIVDAHFKYLQQASVVWVDFPIHGSDTVILQTINKFKKRKYYRAKPDSPINFTITGPLKLRVLVRGEFQYYMHGANEFKFQVLEDDKNKNTYKFAAQRSKKLEYKYNKNLIPGTLKKIYIDVPKGKHTYEFRLSENYNRTILFRFSFDKNGIVN